MKLKKLDKQELINLQGGTLKFTTFIRFWLNKPWNNSFYLRSL